MIPDVISIINSWIVGRHFQKKSEENMEEAVEELKSHVTAEVTRLLEPLLKKASSEQRASVMSTVENSTTAIVNEYISTVVKPFSLRGSAEMQGPNTNITDSSDGEGVGPKRSAG